MRYNARLLLLEDDERSPAAIADNSYEALQVSKNLQEDYRRLAARVQAIEKRLP